MGGTVDVLLDARRAVRGLGIATFVDRLTAALPGAAPDVRVSKWGGDGAWDRTGRVNALSHSGLFDVSPRLDPRSRRFAVIHYASNLGALSTASNSVFTVYDLMHRRRLRPRDRVVGTLLERGVRHAGRVVAISRQTGTDVAAAYPEVAPRLEVIPLGMQLRAGAAVARDHVLAFGGGSDPRKRVDLAIAAYGEYARTSPDPLPLVVLARAGLSEAQRLRLRELGARIVESATADEVQALMAGAGALVYPTAEEGFGLPILEAAEVSTPVVMDAAARVSAEVIGSHCIRVASLAAPDWADAIREAVARGPVDASLTLPDWATVARRYAELYREVER